MDKSRDADRGDKNRGSGLPQRLDLASAVDALYAPWLQQEQTLLSNMFSGAGGGGHNAYSAAAAAAAMGGLGNIPGMPHGYPPVSSAAGLAVNLAAAQQAQQQAQAAALASLGPSAAWWNLANLQQMELLSRLQGGSSLGAGYPGLHPEHLMNLELLQAQHAMAAALSSSKSSATAATTSRTSSNGSSSSSGSTSLKSSSRSGSIPSIGISNRPSHNRSRDQHSTAAASGARSSSSNFSGLENNRQSSRIGSSSSHHHHSSPSSSDAGISVRSDLGSGASGSLSYGIASLMADKLPSSSHKNSRSQSHSSESNRSKSSSSMKSMRNKELEIIPISPNLSDRSSTSLSSKKESAARDLSSVLAAQMGVLAPHSSLHSLPASLSSSSLKSRGDTKAMTNGGPSSGWRDEVANVSIEPCATSTPGGSASSATDDGPLNLSLKTTSANSRNSSDKRESSKDPTAELMNRLKLQQQQQQQQQVLNPFDYSQSLGLGMGLMPDMGPTLEVLQSLYGHHAGGGAERNDVLASMQEALQRQLLAADSKKREEKKKRVRSDSAMEDAQERARHLGRGVSKPKKNTVASLLEHCRAVGIKPQLPLPNTSVASSTSVTTSPPLSLTTTSSSNTTTQSLPPSLIPIFPSSASTYPSSTSPFGGPPTSSTSPLLNLPSSISVSTSPSLLSNDVTAAHHLSPSVTVQPASSVSSRPAPKEIDNRVQITAISGHQPYENNSFGCLDYLQQKRPLSKPSSMLSELSDSESDDSTSISSMDEDNPNSFVSPWLKRDSSDFASYGSPPNKKRKMITDEESLKVPLVHGWRRETTMRGITQSGVRGEVIYFAPCGKPFKQYPDIIRYLERQNINEVTRDHFSFSSKISVGEYVDANTNQKYSEQEIKEIIREIRAKKGLKAALHQSKREKLEGKRVSPPLSTAAKLAALQAKEDRDTLEREAEAVLRRLEAEEKAEKTKRDLISKLEENKHIRAWKEQEKLKKQEELKREKEEQRKQREEINRQRLYEQLKKAQEREQEKQKQKILKDQLYLQELTKQREMLYTIELERERRRYHGVLVRTLEARKRYEEREKKREYIREEKRVFKEKKREERQAARELNLLLKESKEDMELTDHRPLPAVPLVNGIRLPPEAFGNVLMIFEFLHNFGETLGFDMESLPSLHSLQLALLQDSESEEELLSVMSHLLVCAIEDPGIPNSQRNTTILAQTLNRADITHTNISEILRVYLHANATGEVRTIYNLHGTEKERRENPAKSVEFDSRLSETEAFKMSLWLQKIPFLALNATQKSEIVGYICNELLQNKAVNKQIEESLDRHNGLKTEKWKLDARIRKLRMNVARKRTYLNAMRNSVTLDGATRGDDSNMSAASKKNDGDDDDTKHDDELDDEDENDSVANDSDDEEAHHHHDDQEEDKHLNADEASKTLDVLQKQMDGIRQELFETAQQVRGYWAGQDRYQRTFWVLPHAGGPFLEGLSTCDYVGRSHFTSDIPNSSEKEGLTIEEVEALQEEMKNKEEEINPKEEMKKETEDKTVKQENVKNENLKNEDPANVKEEKEEFLPNGNVPKKEEILNGLSEEKEDVLPATVKEETVQSATTTTVSVSSAASSSNNGDSVDKDLVATGLGLIPGQYLRPEHVAQFEKLSFSILPRRPCLVLNSRPSMHLTPVGTPKPGDADSPMLPHSPFVSSNGSTPLTSMTPILQNSLAAHNMSHKELLEKLHQTAEALPIPREYKNGWWHVTEMDLMKELTVALNERGARERELKMFLQRNLNVVKNALEKVDSDVLSFDAINSEEETIYFDKYGVPVPDEPCHWSEEVSLRVDMLALETVYVMEEKITNASMQNKNWRLGEGNEKPRLPFRPSSLDPTDADDTRLNPIHHGRDRLLSLEEGIERRYLKPPLGVVPTPKSDGTSEIKGSLDLPKGLATWREAVSECETAAQLAMCTYMLETAVAWDKSIMKAYCQFCHSGDFEEKLLLCDGCDKGYHTHCFKPPMNTIPDGDWYCYECVNKFSDCSQRHCLVCGGTEGRTLIHCAQCPRAYHTTCINPPLAKVPRNKWNCPACSSKSPRGRRSRAKKPSELTASAGGTAPTPAPETANHDAQENGSTPPVVNHSLPTSQPPTNTTLATTPVTAINNNSSSVTSSNAMSGEQNSTASPPLQPDVAPHDQMIVPPVTISATPQGHQVTSTPNGTVPQQNNNATPKKEKPIKKKDLRELSTCKIIQADLEVHEDAWPFLLPVNTRQFPTYKKIIKKPIDLATITKKLEDSIYKSKDDYSEDLHLMFNNCETFNEDDSPVGKAGHNLRSFFDAKWNENFVST